MKIFFIDIFVDTNVSSFLLQLYTSKKCQFSHLFLFYKNFQNHFSVNEYKPINEFCKSTWDKETHFQTRKIKTKFYGTSFLFANCLKQKFKQLGTSLVVQWLRICLPNQGPWVWPLVWELRSHMPWSNWFSAPQLLSQHSRARKPHLLQPVCLEPVLHKRSHHSEKPADCNQREAPLTTTRKTPSEKRKPSTAKK